MCGRFGASFQYRDIKLAWNLHGDFAGFYPRYNIAPSQDVPVIVRNQSGRAPALWLVALHPFRDSSAET